MKSTSTFDSAERDAFIALSFAEGVGPATLRRIQLEEESFAAVLLERFSASEVASFHTQRNRLLERVSQLGCGMMTMLDAGYPANLLDLSAPPAMLFTQGSLESLNRPVVAIVGTRNCTRYGERIAKELASSLASAGACVVSGLARGIDAAAHRGALSVPGITCGVIGTGVDLTYPVGHASLQRLIAERGLIITESLPGSSPFEGSFPNRNRIIAALSSLVIVVEAPHRSGARNTATHAMNLNRILGAVPGPIDSLQSAGTNELLRSGAQVITSAEDALSLAGLRRSRTPATDRELTASERALVRILGEREMTTQQIVETAGLPITECLAAISSLEVDGWIDASLTGEFRLCNLSAAKSAVSSN